MAAVPESVFCRWGRVTDACLLGAVREFVARFRKRVDKV